MIAKGKILILILGAIALQLSSGAGSVRAANGTLTTSSGGSVLISGAQTSTHTLTLTDHKIGESSAVMSCKSAAFEAVEPTSNGATTFLFHPVYKECTAFGLSATVTTNGCNYRLHVDVTSGGNYLGTLDLSCEVTLINGKLFQDAISITALTCKVLIEPQFALTKVTTSNSGGSGGTEMDLSLQTALSGVNYEVTQDGIGCPLSGVGSWFFGDYTGTTTLAGKNPETGSTVGITLHD